MDHNRSDNMGTFYQKIAVNPQLTPLAMHRLPCLLSSKARHVQSRAIHMASLASSSSTVAAGVAKTSGGSPYTILNR